MRHIFLFLMLVFSSGCFAQDSASAALNQLLSGVKAMRADFTQTVYDGKGRQVQVATGKMALKRPGYFRWETQKPIPQTIIANKNKLWIYDPDLEQVTIRTLQAAAGSTPALFLSHTSDDVTKSYTVSNIKKPVDNDRWFKLVPLSADNMFELIEFGFDGKRLSQMLLKDHLGHITMIKFTQIKSNQSVPNSLFIFKPSDSVDVIDETNKSSR